MKVTQMGRVGVLVSGEARSVSVRVLTFNAGLLSVSIFGRKIFEPAPYVMARLGKIPGAILSLSPDVVALQEVYDKKQRDWLVSMLSQSLPYFVQGRGAKGPWLGDGLMLFSRYEISRASLSVFNASPHFTERMFCPRGFLAADVELGGDMCLGVVNVHATAGGLGQHPEESKVESVRRQQMRQLCDFLDVRSDGHAKMIVGDLNAGPEASPRDYEMLLDRGFVDACAIANGSAAGITWDPANPLNGSGPHRMCPEQRIDHVLVRGHIDIADTRVVLTEPVVSVDAKQVTISDHYGVMAQVVVRGAASSVSCDAQMSRASAR